MMKEKCDAHLLICRIADTALSIGVYGSMSSVVVAFMFAVAYGVPGDTRVADCPDPVRYALYLGIAAQAFGVFGMVLGWLDRWLD